MPFDPETCLKKNASLGDSLRVRDNYHRLPELSDSSRSKMASSGKSFGCPSGGI
jgi:hypothetical protein